MSLVAQVSSLAVRIATELKTIKSAVITTQAASWTLALSEAGGISEYTGAAGGTCTIPINSVVAFPIGTIIILAQTTTAGQITVAGAGVTIDTPSSLKTRQQWSEISLRKRATNEWVVGGDLA